MTDESYINILQVIQAMQLSVVALLFLFTAKSITGTLSSSGTPSSTLEGSNKKRRPTFLIAIGFLLNFAYLILQLLGNHLPDFRSNLTVTSLVFNLNLLTTYCFYLQSVPSLVESLKYRLESIKFGDRWTRLVASSAITVASLLVWSTGEGLVFSLFNFLGYLSLTFYVFHLMNAYDRPRKSEPIRYIIVSGWALWALLQLLKPGAGLFGFSSHQIELTGFAASLVAKCLILFGIYYFSVRIARQAYQTLNEEIELTSSLQRLINGVSNSTDLDDLSGKVVHDLTGSTVFDFDYAVVWEVNSLKNRIFYRNSLTPNPSIERPESWIRGDGIPIEHHDIIAQVVRTGIPVHGYQDMLNNKRVDFDSQKSPLNREIYERFDHKLLNRFYIPVRSVSKQNTSTPNVVAVIEAGYRLSSNRHTLVAANPPRRGELSIYLDNVAQSYERHYEKILSEAVEDLLATSDDVAKDDHKRYLDHVLASVCKYVNADLGGIILVPFQNQERVDIASWYGESGDALVSSEDLIRRLRQAASGAPVINTAFFDSQLKEVFEHSSALVQPIIIPDRGAAFLFVISDQARHSDRDLRQTLEIVAERIGTVYAEKKFHYAVASLVTPDNVITDLDGVMQPLVETLRKYFETQYVCIWLRNTSEDYTPKYYSKALGTLSDFNGQNIDFAPLADGTQTLDIDSNDEELSKGGMGFLAKHGIRNVLRRRLRTDRQELGFIDVYFRRRIDQALYEEENFLNLVAVKAIASIQLHNLLTAFKEISDTFTRNDLGSTLKTITKAAMHFLNADPVILYKSSNGKEVFFKDVTYEHKEPFRDEEILHLFRSQANSNVELAERVINDRSMFFSNKEEFKEYVQRHPKKYKKVFFKQDFWEREGIRSLAAVRLVHRSGRYLKPIGVLFINFREEVQFTPETIRVIDTFASLAAGSIYNATVFERNTQYLLRNLRLTKPIIGEALSAGALHNAKKVFEGIHAFYLRLLSDLDNPFEHGKKVRKVNVRAELEKLRGQISELESEFLTIEALYAPGEPTVIGTHGIKGIIEQQLDIIEAEFFAQNVRIVREYPEAEIFIECDESQIAQACLNVIKNAYQSMGYRGEISIEIKLVKNSEVRIDISDDGKGISDDIRDVMFQPNISDKSDGTGLGLSMSKYVIEFIHRGRINGRTRNGRTTFTIFLPLQHPEIVEEEQNGTNL